MSKKSSSTGTPTAITTATYLLGFQILCVLPALPCFVPPPESFNGGIFPTEIYFSVSKIYFVNSKDVW